MCSEIKRKHFISVKADGGTDFGFLEEILVYMWYLDGDVGKPVYQYLAIQDPKWETGSNVLNLIRTCVTKTTGMEDSEWKAKLTAFGSDGGAEMTGAKNGVSRLLQEDPSTKNFKGF